MIKLGEFKRMLENDEKLPLLTLDEFFEGNTDEESIAPNQWGYGRPTLGEIYAVLQKVEQMTGVEWVRVALHDDTEILADAEGEMLSLAGEAVVLCSTIPREEMEALVNCEWLCSDGVIGVEPLEFYSRVPPVPEGYSCMEIVWD